MKSLSSFKFFSCSCFKDLFRRNLAGLFYLYPKLNSQKKENIGKAWGWKCRRRKHRSRRAQHVKIWKCWWLFCRRVRGKKDFFISWWLNGFVLKKKSSVHGINVIQRWGQGFSLTWSNVWGVTSELPNLTSPHSWLYHSAWLCLDFKWTSSLDCTFNLEFPFWMYSSGENSVESKSASSAECSPVVWNEARRRIQFNVNVGCRCWCLPISIFNLI